jgi:uncharacterized protein (DUF1015 family)
MADSLPSLVEPFRGERYADASRLSNRIAPPYDVITGDERVRLVARSEQNIVHLTLPAGEGDARYTEAARVLAAWRRARVLVPDEDPSVYVVQQEFRTPDGKTHFRTGVIGGVHVEPYGERVRPHEKTHPEPKADRLALARATQAMMEALFFLTRDDAGELLRLLHAACRQDPAAVAELDGTAVGVWRVGGDKGRDIARVAGAGALYMADGHHRYETALAYRQDNPHAMRIPGLIVPIRDPGLIVLPTHRIVEGEHLERAVLDTLGDGARETHDIANPELTVPLLRELGEEGPACAAVLSDGSRRAWLFPDDPERPGIALIEEQVVGPLREAAGRNAAVRYTPLDAEALVAPRGRGAAAVLVNATPVEEVLAVADRGGIMPPKSTYFLPKVPAGLVLMDYRAGED